MNRHTAAQLLFLALVIWMATSIVQCLNPAWSTEHFWIIRALLVASFAATLTAFFIDAAAKISDRD